MNLYLIKILFLFLINFYRVYCFNDTKGIDILPVNSSIACSDAQPLYVDEEYGFISTPGFDGIQYYPPNITCSWILRAKQNESIFIKLREFELDMDNRDGLYVYDGFNASAPLIGSFLGSQRDSSSFRSPGNVLFMHFIGLSNPKSIGFYIYFEQKPLSVHCESTQITCRNGIKCVESKHYCNGIDDCEDGTDEERCATTLDELKFKSGCGRPLIKPIDDSMRIVGGIGAKPGSWPWMVDLRIEAQEPYGHTCGATVLNRQWILSAAHCFIDLKDPNQWRLYFGKYQQLVRDSTQVIRYIDNIYIHPDFKGGKPVEENMTWFDRTGNDLALIKLNAPLPIDRPVISSVCLPEVNEELEPNDMVWVTGWGDTRWTGNELVLKQIKLPIVSNEICRQWMPDLNIGSTQICAGLEEGGRDACQGDSGGPMVRVKNKTNNYEIVGIVSTGNGGCAARKQAGIYTKVSNYVLWIEKTISEHKLLESRLLDTLMKQWLRFKDENIF